MNVEIVEIKEIGMLQIVCLISCILVFITNIICLIKGIKPTSIEDIIKGRK
jgi:hypothetical protein